TLAAIPFSDVTWMRPLGIVHKRHKILSNAAHKFIEMLRQDPKTHRNGTHRAAEDIPITEVGLAVGNGVVDGQNVRDAANGRDVADRRVAIVSKPKRKRLTK